MPNHHHRSRRAFSLIELLVVVTILCLLAALLFAETPVLFRVAQSSNWSLRCNLRDRNPNGLGNIDHAYVIHGTRKFAATGATGVDNCVAANGHAQGLVFTQQSLNLRWPGTRINP